MPVNQSELLNLLREQADNENLRVALKSYRRGFVITAASTFGFAFLLGPLGYLTGGSLGGFGSYLATNGEFKPLSEIIDSMSDTQKHDLHMAMQGAFRDVNIAGIVELAALISTNLSMKKIMIDALIDFFKENMDLQITR